MKSAKNLTTLCALCALFIYKSIAVVGFVLTMIGAGLTHLRLGEYLKIIVNAILFGLAIFVAYGRFVLIPL